MGQLSKDKISSFISLLKAFTLAEVLIAKRERGKMSLLNIFRTSELKASSSGLQKQCAFTLAEVLITLGIIGVVASMTIPTLIQEYKKSVIETKLKETVSILQNMVKMCIVENGAPAGWDELSDGSSDGFTVGSKYFLPFIKTIKNCPLADTTKMCRRTYYFQDDQDTPMQRNNPKYVLVNGVGVEYFKSVAGSRRGVFMIDISQGNSNKLIYGKNAFSFNFVLYDDKYQITTNMDYRGANDDFCGDSRASLISRCLSDYNTPAGNTAGMFCTAMIECNGWQIPDDYPINF